MICFTAAVLAEMIGKVLFGLMKSFYYRITGFRRLCLDETVAVAVSRQYALKLVEAYGLQDAKREETIQRMAEGLHHVLVEYAYCCGERS